MLLLFSIRLAEGPLVFERAVYSVYCAGLVVVCQFLCVAFFSFWY